MSAHIQQAGLFSGRHATFMMVVGLHAVVISGLIAIRIVPDIIKPPPVIELIPIDTAKPPDIRPPDPIPQPVTTATIVVAPPLIPVYEKISAIEAMSMPIDRTMSSVDTGPSIPVAETKPAARVTTELQYQIVRPTDEYYPDASVRLEERGVAVVQVCSDAKGRITSPPTVQASSGHKRLDAAAVRWASESLRFVPATVDGVAIASCKGFRVNFNLR